jgi:SAM-dependent methyltransferase
MFSESLIIISQPHQFSRLNDAGSTFDLVVFQSLNHNALRLIAGLLKPGGLLYWEIDRGIGKTFKGITQKKGDFNVPIPLISLSWHFSRYRNYLSFLEELGFLNMQIYWHRPDFDHGLEIIPLHNRAVLKNIFSRAKGSVVGRFKLAAGRFLMSVDLLKYFVPCISVVACKKESMNR